MYISIFRIHYTIPAYTIHIYQNMFVLIFFSVMMQPSSLLLGQIAGYKVLMHIFSVHSERNASRRRWSALNLINIEAYKCLVLLGELIAQHRLVLRTQRYLLLAEHTLTDKTHLFECEERSVMNLCSLCGVRMMRWRGIPFTSARRRARRCNP